MKIPETSASAEGSCKRPPDDEKTNIRRTRSLSKSLVDLADTLRSKPETIYDVVIVGSGYGGSVAAHQLASAKKNGGKDSVSVCLLERGNEYLPGMFPNTFALLPGHLRVGVQGTGRVSGDPEGLFDLRPGDDVAALVANGLGGGSLINAGVLAKPKFDEFDSRMPSAVVNALTGKYLQEARELLLGKPLATVGFANTIDRNSSNCTPNPLKHRRLFELGSRQRQPLLTQAADITVAMQDVKPNPFSVDLNACNGCGDCMTGCNVGAKASLDTNLLAQANDRGAEIYTGSSVLALSRGKSKDKESMHWVLDVVHTSSALRRRQPEPLKVRAYRVILAAGTFGSTEVLLRSRSEELIFSNMLGERFSCNGDNIAALHRLPDPAHCTDDENIALAKRHVGPTITNIVEVPRLADDQLGFLIQEFAVPAPLKRLFSELVTTGQAVSTLPSQDRTRHGTEDGTDPCAVNEDAVENTLLVGLIGHDDAAGALRLPLNEGSAGQQGPQEGIVQIVWPRARDGVHINAAHERLTQFTKKAFPNAKVIANPMWRLLPKALEDLVDQPRGPVMTVHPLGGCPMGEDGDHGVVDCCGRVFNLGSEYVDATNRVDDWSGSLIVLDGSIVPGSLGANPALTISALALRAMEELMVTWEYESFKAPTPVRNLPSRPRFSPAMPAATTIPKSTEIEVTERLVGKVHLHAGMAFPEICVVEMTMQYAPKNLQSLMTLWSGREMALDPEKSYLRVYAEDTWNKKLLGIQDDVDKDEHAIWRTNLTGTLRFLHREPSTYFIRSCRALWAYACNRGWRDLWQKVAEWLKRFRDSESTISIDSIANTLASVGAVFTHAWRLASRAGEVRRFDYALNVVPISGTTRAESGATFNLTGHNSKISGHKRLTYNRRANPWSQLMELTLTQMPFMPAGTSATLHLDTRFMAKNGVALVKLTAQANQPNALLDMASFGLFMARLLLSMHLWTFRKPDTPLTFVPQRLPGDIAGLPKPRITELTVAIKIKGTNAVVRLTNYPQPQSNHPPLAMIHGYSVSGTTFTHPSLQPSAAEFFWHQGRDIWVIDLRTSAGVSTSSLPWSFEEAALVDIPAALLHIKNVTGQRVDVLAHCIGAAMLSMALLSDARKIKVGTTELGIDTWITPRQLGTLSAFNGDGSRGPVHPTVRSVVLSQKGPLLRYTDANIFRAYLMRTLRRWLVPNGFQFRPSEKPGVSEQLMDRLLSSLPYPAEDYDMENPAWPCDRTPWTASRHRMDALYARDFSAQNLRPETLNAIDDLFGPINIDTVTQVIHFVRFNCITNQRGRGEFVTLDNLTSRWRGIPTFAIHGADNGLVDVSTQDLLKSNFNAAGIPFDCKVYPGLGHQDVLIGKTSAKVFNDIENFLTTPPTTATSSQPVIVKDSPTQLARKWAIQRPWIGPRIKAGKDGALSIFAMSSPRFGNATLLLVPINTEPNTSQGVHRPERCGAVLNSKKASNRNWLSVALPICKDDNVTGGWLAVVAYRLGQTSLREIEQTSGKTNPANKAPAAGRTPTPVDGNNTTLSHHSSLVRFLGTAPEIKSALAPPPAWDIEISDIPSDSEIDDWLKKSHDDLRRCFISKSNIARSNSTPNSKFSFALGSCQYPPGLVDKKLAEKSLQRMADLVGDMDFVVLAGDQIYADASAGLVDPVRSDERFDIPYETALRSEPMREIMRRTQVHMMLDDHEIADNWEPPHWKNEKSSRLANRQYRQGIQAYWKYQRMDNRTKALYHPVSFSFDHGGAAFYMLDTRSRRSFRGIGSPRAARMFRADELANLTKWLCAEKTSLKFIVSPSILLPRRLGMLNDSLDQASRSDAWEGYPACMKALFDIILDNEIDNVVFLSGDEHVSCIAQATLSKNGVKARKIVSVHASGLYSPFPFANSKPYDFVSGKDIACFHPIRCESESFFIPPGDAFARISISFENDTPTVGVEFCQAEKTSPFDDIFNF